MSDYKGFITRAKLAELTSLLSQIADTRGMENKLHHLYQPDTDMNDKICEILEESKMCILLELYGMMKDLSSLARKILQIKEEN